MKKSLLGLTFSVLLVMGVACSNDTSTAEKEDEVDFEEINTEIENDSDGSEDDVEEDQDTKSEATLDEEIDENVELSLEEKVELLLITNFKYAQNKDIDGYMSQLTAADNTPEQREWFVDFFANYNLEFTLLEFEIIEETDEWVEVKLVQKTTGEHITDSSMFSPNISTSIQTLVYEEGELKFYGTEVIEQELIEE